MELGPKRWNWGQIDGIDLAKPMESGQKIGHGGNHALSISSVGNRSITDNAVSTESIVTDNMPIEDNVLQTH